MIKFLKRYVFHNIGLKALSLLIAVLLWMAVARNPVTEIAVNVPIEFQHVPDSLEISTEHIPEVQIRVRGPERLVHELDRGEVHATIDLAGARPGERTYDLTGKQINVPQGVEVTQVVPSQFRVSFDRRASKQVEVRPRVIGTFASGYRIAKVEADPARVTIIGPEKRVHSIENALTDPVDATGVVGRASFTTNIYVADPLVRIARPKGIRVTVTTEKTGRHGVGPVASAEKHQ
ncbi:MAG TPA: CdaR family protein [Terriglobales bacterium]|nr:CdaR family protein [Terriglobales bacterium]